MRTDHTRKIRSPYQRHGKKPYRYSELYHRWRAAAIEGRSGDAARLGDQHSRANGLYPPRR